MSNARTSLTLEALTKIHEEARKLVEGNSGFAPPGAGRRAGEVMKVRGRRWAESVLLRSLPAPSFFFRTGPDMNETEILILALADKAEWELTSRNTQGEK